MAAAEPKVRWNERLDHLQADHPFTYNLVTGLVLGLVALLVGIHWALALAYVLSWAAIRAFLWQDGRILRRQYDERQVRMAEKRRTG
jgi:hypothetical protein